MANGRRRWLFEENSIKRLFVSREMRELGYRWYEHPAFADYDFKKGMDRISKGTDELLASLGYELDHELHMYKVTKPSDERVALFAHQGFGLAFISAILACSLLMCEGGFVLNLVAFSPLQDLISRMAFLYANCVMFEYLGCSAYLSRRTSL